MGELRPVAAAVLSTGAMTPEEGEATPTADGEPWGLHKGRGLLAREVFEQYGAASGGRLGASELHWLLRDHGIVLDHAGACRTLAGAVGPGEHCLDYSGFLRLVEDAGARRRAYTDAVIIVLHCIFKSYDRNGSGSLEKQECFRLFADCGRTAETAKDSKELCKLIASCRPDGTAGPVGFEQFLALLRCLMPQGPSREGDYDPLLDDLA